MKVLFALMPTLATLVLATKPNFLNSDFNVTENKSFTLKFEQCANGCTIVIQTGPETGKKNVKTLTADARHGAFTFTPSNIPTGTYNFMISDNDGNPKDVNYSNPFEYVGTGPAFTSASASNAPSSSASASSAPASTASKTTSTSDSTSTENTKSTYTIISTGTPVTSSTTHSTSSSAIPSTTIPNAAAHATPFAIIAGAVAVVACLG